MANLTETAKEATKLIEEMLREAERDFNRAGWKYIESLEKVEAVTNRLADAEDYAYGLRVSELTEAAQEVARYHQESKTLQDHIAALKQTLKAAQG